MGKKKIQSDNNLSPNLQSTSTPKMTPARQKKRTIQKKNDTNIKLTDTIKNLSKTFETSFSPSKKEKYDLSPLIEEEYNRIKNKIIIKVSKQERKSKQISKPMEVNNKRIDKAPEFKVVYPQVGDKDGKPFTKLKSISILLKLNLLFKLLLMVIAYILHC